jgi:ATP-dependent DNA helicase
LKLQNLVMQLRKVCNHVRMRASRRARGDLERGQPWLFDWPIDPDTGANIVNEDLINASGKMLMLNRLVRRPAAVLECC